VERRSPKDIPPKDIPASRAGWHLMGTQLRRQRPGLTVGVVAGLTATISKVAVPALVALAIDRGIEADTEGALLRWSLAILLAGVLSSICSGLRRWFAFREARWCEAALRDRIFAHLQRLHFAFHDDVQTGQLMSRANTDLQQVQAFVVMIPITISNAATVLAASVIMFSINPLLALLALGPLPLVNVLARRFSGRLFPSVMAIQAESAELATVVEETVSGIRVVKGFGSEGVQAQRLRAEAGDVYERSIDATRVRARYMPVMDLLPNLGLLAVLAYGGHLVIDGELTVGQLVAFNAYVALLIWPLRMTGQIVAQGQRAAAAAGRVAEVLDTEFSLSLGSPEVQILDPCTGTGNFIVNLLGRIPKRDLPRMYRDQLFANEVMLMPYYIAALNIEHAYYELIAVHAGQVAFRDAAE